MHRRTYLYGIIIAAMMVITACSGNDEPSSGATEPPVASPTQTTQEPGEPATTPEETVEPTEEPTESAAPTQPVPEASDPCTRSWPDGTSDRHREATKPHGSLAKVRVGSHGTCDRVSFTLTGLSGIESVGYSARYVDVVEQGGSGNPIAVKGNYFIQLEVHALPPAPGAEPEGPLDYERNWPALQGVTYGGWYEDSGHVFAIGVAKKVPVHVAFYGGVLYIDLQRPS